MQRLHNITKWTHVQNGGAMNFEDERERRIRLDVNAAGKASLFYVDGDGETTLLGLVEGRDVIEFQTHGGSFSIAVEDSDVWVFTIDGENVSFSIPDAQTFTKLVERRTRNPETEMMQYMMQRNFEKMVEQQRDELVRVLDQRDKALAAATAKPAPASDDKPSAAKPEPAKPAAVDGGDKPSDGGNGTKA